MIIRVSCFRLTHYESSNFKNRLSSCFNIVRSRSKILGPWFSYGLNWNIEMILVEFWMFSNGKIEVEHIFDYFQLYLDFKSKSIVPLKNFWSFRLFRNNSLIWLTVSTPVLIRHYDNLIPSVILSRNWK